MLVAPTLAQSRLHAGTSPAVAGPDYDLSVGYTYLKMPIPGAGRVLLRGIDVSGRVNFKPHWGAMLDANYVRTPNVLGTKHMGYLLAVQGGPVFYPVNLGNTRMFVHVLGGMGLVDGAVPRADATIFHGWQSQFSYAAGGGVERALSGPFAVRVNGDLVRTAFFDSAGALHPQNNLRLTVSFVYRLRNRLDGAVTR
jgi:hypothetical protein